MQSDSLGLRNDNGLTTGLPSQYQIPARERFTRHPSPGVDAALNASAGFGTYWRGQYRNFRHFLRQQGALGKCEKIKAAIEGAALAEVIRRIANDEGLAGDVNYQFWDTALSNGWRSSGRLLGGTPASAYMSARRGLIPGLGTAGVFGAGGVAGDIRHLVETQGPHMALDKLGQVAADGNVPDLGHRWLDDLVDCSCDE